MAKEGTFKGSQPEALLKIDYPAMKLSALFARRDEKQVWAALCTASADGMDARYRAEAKHAILVMVCATESGAETKVAVLLEENGWNELTLKNLKLLSTPFVSEDPDMYACYRAALDRGGGIISTPTRLKMTRGRVLAMCLQKGVVAKFDPTDRSGSLIRLPERPNFATTPTSRDPPSTDVTSG